MQESVVAEEFKLIRLIGKGSHCQIYYGISIKTGKQYGIKTQSSSSTSLFREASLLTSIQQSIHAVVDYGLPFCVHVEKGEKRNYLVETLLGNNLHSLLKKCGGIFKVKTFLMVAEQMIKRLELLHRKGFIHRSVGLKKWVFGRGEHRKKLYLVGYGRSKQYSKKGEHIEYSQSRPLLNHPLYASINNHLGLEPSRRDDLESMLYCWAKMLFGKLPWQGETEQDRILSRKIQNRSEVLFSNFPGPLIQIGQHIRNLGFQEDPDFNKMRNLVTNMFESYGGEPDYCFDWEEEVLGELQSK